MNTATQTEKQLGRIAVKDTYTAKEILIMARQAGLTVNETVRILQQRLLSSK